MYKLFLPGALLLTSLVACDDHLFPAGEPEPIEGEGWCAVRDVIAGECLACHGAAVKLGSLDLETDPGAALIGVPSAAWPAELLVDVGSPETSLLYRKVTATHGDLGTEMPPSSGGLPVAITDVIAAWITDGAPTVCEEAPPTGVHPPGYGVPDMHGQDAKLQVLPCTECHGATLEGDVGIACNSACHGGGPEWPSNCSWCHGSDATGLPPEDIDDSDPTNISFPGHGAHVAGEVTRVLDCTECHAKPTDAFSSGHIFVGDVTPAVAEVRFDLGTFTDGAYASGTCTVYCHGDGTGTGAVSRLDGPRACNSCHDNGAGLSGPHGDHLEEGLVCGTCHGGTASGLSTIVGPDQHVDGAIDLALPPEITRVNGQCTGTCHGEIHAGRTWADDDGIDD